MSIVKSFAVGDGDTYYIQHNSDNFTIIDCFFSQENQDRIIEDILDASKGKGIQRFISTHPDQDHFQGIEELDRRMPISNFYVVKNSAKKSEITTSFSHYCKLRDDTTKAYYVYKGCSRKWMNLGDGERATSGINILWPDTSNKYFTEALHECNVGLSYNNLSLVCRYALQDGASFMWLGDLETDFMENILDDIQLSKTTIVFAAHHGRESGKIPDSWLKILDPQIIVIGEAPSRHLNYYTGYKTITQNKAGDITFECVGEKVHVYASKVGYTNDALVNEGMSSFDGYVGSLTVETEYTL